MHKENNWKQAFKVCRVSILKWKSEPRMWAVLALLFLFEWTQISTIREYCATQELSISNWYFPFFFSGGFVTLFLYMGILLVFCDAPFVDSQQLYVILRTGSKNWFIGKIIYIFVTSGIYFLIMYVVSLIELIPYLGFSTNWEMIIESLAANGDTGKDVIVISQRVINSFSPIQAAGLCFLLNFLCAAMIGLLVFYINLHGNGNIGVGVGFVIVLLSQLENLLPVNQSWGLQYFSPLSWVNLDVLLRDYGGVSLKYALIFLVLSIALLLFLIMQRQKSYSIDTVEEV